MERHEFQLRAAIHTHSLLWTEKSIDQLIAEDFIRADIPDPIEEPLLYHLVIQHQIHQCRQDLCGGNAVDDNRCTKGFPAELSEKTYQRPHELRYTYKRLKEEDRWVVPYSPRLLLLWKAHINVQYCTTGGLAKYISKYVTKPEPKRYYQPQQGNAIEEHILARRIGSMEMMMLLLGHAIFRMSNGSIFLPTTIPELRPRTVKPMRLLQTHPEADPFFPSAIEHYFQRPKGPPFDELTYFQYFAQYQRFTSTSKVARATSGIPDQNGARIVKRTQVCV